MITDLNIKNEIAERNISKKHSKQIIELKLINLAIILRRSIKISENSIELNLYKKIRQRLIKIKIILL